MLGEVQRIFYFHVPLAWNMFLAFFIAFIASILYLATRKERWDIWAVSAAETGVVFATLATITGSLWARPAWGTYWTWDPRLTTMLILWFLFVGYLLLREFIDDPERRARVSAVVAIIAFLDVPLVFLSVRLWRSLHPVIFEAPKAEKVHLSPKIMAVFFFCLAVLTLLYLLILLMRVEVEVLRRDVAHLKEREKEALP